MATLNEQARRATPGTRLSNDSVIIRLQSARNALDPAERKVADFLLSNTAQVINLPIAAVAERSGVSAGTVVRTCSDLGYSGYRELRMLLARDDAIVRLRQRQAPPTSIQETDGEGMQIIARVRATVASLQSITDSLDAQALDRALELIRHARHILILASGLSIGIGNTLQSRLAREKILATFIVDPMAQDISAASLGKDDLVIAISGSGENAHTISTTRTAHSAGVNTLAITIFSNSTLAHEADVTVAACVSGMDFSSELIETSRLPLDIMVEAVMEQLRGGDDSELITMISQHLEH
ncbi:MULTISPECIES: MurR/RpiR family transcriptional regulator [Bifidobacterium]|jgi:DNA-binding MurR/RpiR family transcriptional regulator|uniref:MurR/RpiR family transcriptional regulator n=1 Tax=Bifidobacterium tibiigranuli TaxID=2172043 RepID=A0A5N6S6C5_9BIFI|nr:MurR/RpiR family transcriptional regulator [Bifidobacterium tibiigranuli]KAE8129151.1 MurR/RpiR family transcriptional regulator [Bifidobacterium tibiigranuli]KAE8129389.1 MurR/RpiR family transcriptional regulator [Bifidobacterium tibiigranuli]MCH3975356.1 MurR/RpiR family transcriptional regulator [Bifidobacterium tibiigranuli]MCH4189935.1 MurR/RpiR family transcriptional regulator [Bifidobacterium tibiigranuli]MCH4203555.1 MurR/RpiR family transcriptional regulator [Bifidobacterium tibii